MLYSLLDRVAAHFNCDYEQVADLLKENANRKYVEQLLQEYDCAASLDGKIYGVHFAGLTSDPVNKIFCHVHGLMLDEEYLYNFELKLKHPELPCVISEDPNGITYYFPMEIIETMDFA